MIAFSILGSLFLGSSLSKIITWFVIRKFDLDFFRKYLEVIPSLSKDIALNKTFDFIEFVLFILLSGSVFLLNLFMLKKSKIEEKRNATKLLGIAYLLSSILIFLETHFVDHSGTSVLIFVVMIQAIYNLALFVKRGKEILFNGRILANGFIAGFYLLLVFNNLTTSIAIPLAALIITPLIYLFLEDKFKGFVYSPLHLILVLSSFFSTKLIYLIVIGISVVIMSYLLRKIKIITRNLESSFWLKYVYIAVILLIVFYNPLFYLGTFDSVEEGFWLGWLQRILIGQRLYLDVAVYHPPLIIWGLYIFTKLFGASIYNFRLYMHLLQILGLFVIYLITDNLISKKIIKIFVIGLIMSFVMNGVKNNVEIRLGLGLASILPIFLYLKGKGSHYLILSGVLTSISIFASIEVGISACITLLISTLLIMSGTKDNVLKRLSLVVGGLCIGIVPFLLAFILQGSLQNFLKQIFFYTSAFSKGYLSVPVERPSESTLLQWYIVNQYVSSTSWMWEFTKMGILSVLMFIGYRFVNKIGTLKDKFALILAIFNLILFRSALGRSDTYHLLFVLIIAVILIAYVVENLSKNNKLLGIGLFLLIILVFARGETQLGFMQSELIKYQTYANPSGNYPSYQTKRAKILTGVEVDTKATDDLINYIQENTTREEKIFVYPWSPEIYFLADRMNSTSFDTPLAFFSEDYQKQMIYELEKYKPKIIVYNPSKNFANLTPGSLPLVNSYLLNNYLQIKKFGENIILK